MKSLSWSKLVILIAALGLTASWGWRIHSTRPSDLLKEPLVSVPNFSFQDRNGRKVSNKDLEGKVWVTGFIFTRCAGICPMLSAEMKKLQETWKDEEDLALVSFTVDPQRDTVEVLKKYAESLGAQERWYFLTGKKKDLYSVIREGFLLTAEEDEKGGPGFEFIHTSRIVLVDAKGKVRGFYDSQQEADMRKLSQDVRHLMKSRGKS